MPQIFPNIAALRAYINTYIVANSMNEITGDEDNTAMNGILDAITASMVNSGLVHIWSTGGAVVLPAPMTVITTNTPATLTWNDNIPNEYYIINRLGAVIPLLTGITYVDAYGTVQTSIPSNSVIHIAKATNGSWVQVDNLGSSGGSGNLPPEAGNAGRFLTNNGTVANWGDPHLSLTSSDFQSDGVTYLNALLNVTSKVSVFYSAIPNFIYESDGAWQYVAGGLKILIPGFNATTDPTIKIELFFKSLNTPVIPPGTATSNTGASLQSGDGSTSVFAIPHGLIADPTFVAVNAGSSDALTSTFYLTHDATNIYVHYAIAPAVGVNNLTFYWQANL